MNDETARRTAQGRRVLMARTGAGLSRQKFAELVSELWEHVSREYVRRVEIGDKDPGLGFLLAASEVTGWPLPWFTEPERLVIDVMSTWEKARSPWFPRPIDISAAA